MRKLFIALLALTFAVCLPTSADAQVRRRVRLFQPRVRYTQPMRPRLFANNGQTGPVRQAFSNLMELERRKNAWLMSTFFNR